MIHIVFYAPYPGMNETIDEVFSQRSDRKSLSYEIILDQFNNPLKNSTHGDVIISRGFTATSLKKTELTSVELTISGYDVIKAVDKCLRKHPCKKIAVVGAFNMVYGSESINSVYRDVEICSYTTETETVLPDLIKQAIQNGADAIVGGCSTVDIARKYGVPAVLIESGKEAINSAIDNAIQAVAITRRERRKSNEIAGILNYSFEGIISTDAEGTITLANNSGTTLLSRSGPLLGQNLSRFFPSLPWQDVIEKGEMLLSQLYRTQNSYLLLNCIPIHGKRENTGAVITFQDVTRIQKEEESIRKKTHGKGFVARYSFQDILYRDKQMEETIRIARRYSDSDSNLLIFGETGTGKELFAQSIHNASRRKNGPFVGVNCAALPEHLLESELFGYVDGAFTGAAKGGKAGLFEIAHNGTIFLDEIGDISLNLQVRLLRVLQEREIIRLGDDKIIPIDVRVLSATHKSLQEEVAIGNFRQDLLYRLNVLKLTIPALRQRRADIPALIDYYIQLERERSGCILCGLDSEAMKVVCTLPWRGNVRELRNFCERICVLCEAEYATAHDVYTAMELHGHHSAPAWEQTTQTGKTGYAKSLEETDRDAIIAALQANNGNRTKTAAALGIDKSTLWRKMKRYGIH